MNNKVVRSIAVAIMAMAPMLQAQDDGADQDLDVLLGTSPERADDGATEGAAPPQSARREASSESGTEPYATIAAGEAEAAGEDLPARPSANRLIEEIVVTAQKREEYLQDVPIMINAFSGEKLDAFGIENTADLQRITPGLSYTYTYGYSVIYRRRHRRLPAER